jgi:predicted nucleic acid-binding protein
VPVKVVDASALGALVFGEPRAQEVATLLTGSSLAAPALWRYEMGSVCLKKIRRYPGQREALLAGFALAEGLGIEEVEVPVPEVILLAERLRLTVYDAAYVWVARALRAELVTLDARLRRSTSAR